jgi:hypothetical protein
MGPYLFNCLKYLTIGLFESVKRLRELVSKVSTLRIVLNLYLAFFGVDIEETEFFGFLDANHVFHSLRDTFLLLKEEDEDRVCLENFRVFENVFEKPLDSLLDSQEVLLG